MTVLKEVWYDVMYKDTSEKKQFPRTRSFKKRKDAESFFEKLDSSRFDKHLVMYEKSLLNFSDSTYSKKQYSNNFEV